MPVASESEIGAFLDGHDGWDVERGELVRVFTFADFAGSMAFVDRVAEAAEAANHHPDIDIRWNKVRIALSTHSEGGISTRDFDLAAEVDTLARPA
jgi:4a-hydroxytetrahydrobiopterin dehydratase